MFPVVMYCSEGVPNITRVGNLKLRVSPWEMVPFRGSEWCHESKDEGTRAISLSLTQRSLPPSLTESRVVFIFITSESLEEELGFSLSSFA